MQLKSSLQDIKDQLQKKEKILKRIQHNYPHLVPLSEKQICIYFEVNSLDDFKNIPIQIHTSKQSLQSLCTCIDSQKKLKDLYQSEASVLKQKKLSHIALKIYQCPTTTGWHLTKK